jgi:hypothetical protein
MYVHPQTQARLLLIPSAVRDAGPGAAMGIGGGNGCDTGMDARVLLQFRRACPLEREYHSVL